MSDSALPTVTLRREDWERIQDFLKHLKEMGEFSCKQSCSEDYIPRGRHAPNCYYDDFSEDVERLISIKPVEEVDQSALCERCDKIVREMLNKMEKSLDFRANKKRSLFPVKSEEKKCEHDKGSGSLIISQKQWGTILNQVKSLEQKLEKARLSMNKCANPEEHLEVIKQIGESDERD